MTEKPIQATITFTVQRTDESDVVTSLVSTRPLVVFESDFGRTIAEIAEVLKRPEVK